MNCKRLVTMFLLTAWVLCLPETRSARAELGPPVPEGKKLIGWATTTLNTNELRRRVSELEQMPFDGVIIPVWPDAFRKEGVPFTRTGPYTLWFGSRRHTRDEFREAIADLKATKFQRFTDNFFYLGATVRTASGYGDLPDDWITAEEGANLDWFSEKWSVATDNVAVAAHIAREGGLKGFFLDVEPYGAGVGPWRFPFLYRKYVEYTKEAGKTPRSFDEYETQVRKRGRQFMQAATAVYPDITIIMIPDSGWESGRLVRSFTEGMLEARGEATVVDGIEQGYSWTRHKEFLRMRTRAESAHASELYGQMEYGFGVWWDKPGPGGWKDWRTEPGELNKNHHSPERLEHALYNALTAADRYVWVYGGTNLAHTPGIWWNSSWPRADYWVKELPQAYLDAFKNCRKPHDLAWAPRGTTALVSFDGVVLVEGDKITGAQQNLLKNEDLENWTAGKDTAPDDWTLVDNIPAVVSRDDASAKVGRYAAQLRQADTADYGHISLNQVLPAESLAGKTVTFGAWIRTTRPDVANLAIAGNGYGWVHSSDPHPGDGQWRFVTVTGMIPQDAAGNVIFLLKVFIQYSPPR